MGRGGADISAPRQAAVDKLPEGPTRDEARAALERAREQSLQAEVQLANSIGYKLCKRHRPAEVMTSIGRDAKWNIEQFKCPSCGDLQPSDLYIRSLDRDDTAQARPEIRRGVAHDRCLPHWRTLGARFRTEGADRID